jgi:hypothetical protein
VGISGDYAIVGAFGKNSDQGKAYIFKRTGTAWAEEAGIVASDGETYDYFGFSVSISGDYAIVAARLKDVGANDNQGKAYIFKRTGTAWAEQAGIVASDGAAFDQFGYSVSISGDYAIVGAANVNSSQGKAYIFKRTGTGWAEQAGIVASDGAAGYYFGLSMSLSGDYAIVGAYRTTVGTNNQQGKVYYFSRD